MDANRRGGKTLDERRLEAEVRSSQWIADGHSARKAGDIQEADRCYQKGQFWLDRLNLLENRAAKAAPKQ